MSADFLASDYCYEVEMQQALEQHECDRTRVIPVILRPVDWEGTPFARLQALPRDARPVEQWCSRDAALSDIARGVREAVEEMRRPGSTPAAV